MQSITPSNVQTQLKLTDSETKMTLERLDIDPAWVISDIEFRRPNYPLLKIRGGTQPDYREKTIDRLLKLKVNFQSNCNILRTMVHRMVKITCPICGQEIKPGNSGGNFESEHFAYQCECGVSVGLNLPCSGGISVSFKE